MTPAGYALKSTLLDIIDIYDVNRKECARILLEFPKWTPPGTFRPKPNPPPGIQVPDPVPGKDWQLENTIVDNVLGSMFALPDSRQTSMYYIALITELCKLSPSTVGPAVGKSIRKLYGFLGDGLDVEVGHKFAEWFSVHMSNFNFQWVWKEWFVSAFHTCFVLFMGGFKDTRSPTLISKSKAHIYEESSRIRDQARVLRSNFSHAARGSPKPSGSDPARSSPRSRLRVRRSRFVPDLPLNRRSLNHSWRYPRQLIHTTMPLNPFSLYCVAVQKWKT